MSLTQALWAIGGAVGSQIGGYSGAKLGRKATLIANNFLIIPGTLLQVSFLWSLTHIMAHNLWGIIFVKIIEISYKIFRCFVFKKEIGHTTGF